MSTAPAWVVGLAVIAALGTGCGTDRATGPGPGSRVQPSVGPGGPSAEECASRVDALIDSRTIPRADRDYAIGMCTDNR